MKKHSNKEKPDLLDLLENSPGNNRERVVVDSAMEKEFSYRLLSALIPSEDGSRDSDDAFTLEEITSPEECTALTLPTAEDVIAHIVELYPSQFMKTREVLNVKSNAVHVKTPSNPMLDEIIAGYFDHIL